MAAFGGHLNVLKYAYENGCAWDKWVCIYAVEKKNLDILKYVRKNGCPWDEKTHKNALKIGYKE